MKNRDYFFSPYFIIGIITRYIFPPVTVLHSTMKITNPINIITKGLLCIMIITKDILASEISARVGTKKGVTRQIIDEIFDFMQESLASNNKVVINGFGSLRPITTKERIGTDPNNGNTKILLPSKRKIKFQMGATLERKVNTRCQKS